MLPFLVSLLIAPSGSNAPGWPQHPLTTAQTHPLDSAPLIDQSPSGRKPTLTKLVDFSFSNGAYPNGKLTLGQDGNFYGMTSNGGNIAFCVPLGCGTFFKMTPSGRLKTLHIFFNLAFGYLPTGGFALGKDKNFYGPTFGGGGNLDGNILRMTPGGRVTKVVDFNGDNGRSPYANLILARNGNFYGTTLEGGSGSQCPDGCGTVFQLTPSGRLTTLVNFKGRNGAKPSARLLQVQDGSFYGTTAEGGENDKGTVFKLTPSGQLKTLVSFKGRNGKSPEAGLTLGRDGMLYGTTAEGGAGNQCRDGCGTVFRMTPSGQLKTLVSFKKRNGSEPIAPVTLGPDGDFYGTTYRGGTSNACTDGCGTLFKITPSGQLKTLVHFNKTNGSNPAAELVLDKSDRLYGSTYLGGKNSAGTIFRLSL